MILERILIIILYLATTYQLLSIYKMKKLVKRSLDVVEDLSIDITAYERYKKQQGKMIVENYSSKNKVGKWIK